MKTTVRAIALIAFAAAQAGCSSFKLGAACYVPYGVTGQCSATTVEPGIAAPAPSEGAAAGKKKT